MLEIAHRHKQLLGRFIKVVLYKRIGQDVVGTEFGKVIGPSPTHRILHGDLRIKQDLNGICQLVLDAKVGLHMQQVNKGICEGCLLFVDGLEHVAAHQDRIMVEQRHQNVDTSRSY